MTKGNNTEQFRTNQLGKQGYLETSILGYVSMWHDYGQSDTRPRNRGIPAPVAPFCPEPPICI